MIRFHYSAMNPAGQEVSADIDAATEGEALEGIRRQGCFPLRLVRKPARKRPAGGGGRPKIVLHRIAPAKIAEFTGQLSILQDAGLPLLRSLQILTEQQKPGPLKATLAAVAGAVEDGTTLSEAMARHPRSFNRLYTNMVAAGESGGVLDVILRRLAEFMEKSQRLRRRVLGALIYPAAVLCFSLLIVTGIMMFVVPRFQEIFRDFRTTLPALTVALMATADFIANDHGWAFVLGAPIAGLVLVRCIRATATGRRLLDRAQLRLPVLGDIIAKTAVARFCRTLGTLLAAGVPILDALAITRDTVGNTVYVEALRKVQDAIREGEPFAGPLRATRVCDALVVNMIDVGEETGDLDKMLLKIADTYEDKVDVLVNALVSLLEPVMVIALGGIVGTIVVALFLPLARIIQTLGG